MPDCSSSDYKKKKQLTYLMKKLPLNHLQNLSQLQGRILKKKEEERKSVLWQTKIQNMNFEKFEICSFLTPVRALLFARQTMHKTC
jgi:hypothetical protein